jgi:ADP-heptose:LPS heptosyltransferase
MRIGLLSSEHASGGGRSRAPTMPEIDAAGAPCVQELASPRSACPDRRRLLVMLRVLGARGFLTAVPAFHALAEAFPHHRRILAAPAELVPLALLCGGIDGIVPINRLSPLPRCLHRADIAVNLDARAPVSHRILLDTSPRRLVAFAHDEVLGGHAGSQWIEGEPDVERWCRMLEGHGIRANPFRLALRHPPAPRHDALGATVMEPGGPGSEWRWPIERWVTIVRAERASGRRVVLTGRSSDAGVAFEIAHRAGLERRAVRIDHVGVTELAQLAAAAGRVVCGDTVLAHLATAMSTPSVLLFGPTSSPNSTPPLHRAWHRVLWPVRRTGPHDAGARQGLLAIPVDRVLDALMSLPAPTAADGEAARLLA